MFIFLLLSCMLYLRCSVRNFRTKPLCCAQDNFLFAAEQRVGYQITWIDLLHEASWSEFVGLLKLVREFNIHKVGVNLPCRLYMYKLHANHEKL